MLEGPLVWLEKGELDQLNKKDLKGAIALVSYETGNMAMILKQGAKAVVFVGNGNESQWQVRHFFTDEVVAVPRLYMSRETAEKYNLTQAQTKQASLELKTIWEDRVATNLWLELSGQANAVFNNAKEEVLVLAATLDTFGTVPEYCPQLRQAANCALLADVVCKLAQAKTKRSIIAVFLGSHYSAQDGSRHFYYAVEKSTTASWNTDPLETREQWYRDELKLTDEKLSVLNHSGNAIFNVQSDVTYKTLKLIRKKLDVLVDNLNYDMQQNLLAQLNVENPEELKKQEAEIKAQKKIWNNLRREMKNKKIVDLDNFAKVVALVKSDLESQRNQVNQLINNNLSYQKLSKHFSDKLVVGHYGFDFANAESDWLFNMQGFPKKLVYPETVTLGNFAKNLRTLGEIYNKLDHSKWQSKLSKNSLDGFAEPNGFCVPFYRSVPCTPAIGAQVYGYQLMTVGDSLDYDEMPVKKNYDLKGLSNQLSAFINELGNNESLSQRSSIKRTEKNQSLTYRYENCIYYGYDFKSYSIGSNELSGPSKNAVITVYIWGKNTVIAGHYNAGCRGASMLQDACSYRALKRKGAVLIGDSDSMMMDC